MSATYKPSRPPGSRRPPRSSPGGRSVGPAHPFRAGGGRRPLANFRVDPASPFRHVDLVLLAATFVLIAFSALMVYSATRGPAPPYRTGDGVRVLFFGIIGTVAMVAMALVDHRRLRDWWPFVYGGSLLLLLAVLLPGLGSSEKGAERWIALPGFQLQPSEPMKLAMIVGFAGLAVAYRGEFDTSRIATLVALCAIPMGLVLLQPDLGTALVSIGITFALLLVTGIRTRVIGLLALAGIVVAAAVLTSGALKQYQIDRLTSYTKQDQEVRTDEEARIRLNLEKSKQAIGSGGLTGKGLFNGTLTRTGGVPEQRTDFIFTAVGEQFGLLGSTALLGLLGVVMWRVWRAAQLASDELGTYLCTGIMVMLLVQTFVNVGMTIGIMPITGIPLPLMSYGGSALITTMAALGLVQGVHMRRFT